MESEELTRIEPPSPELPRFALDLSAPEVSRDPVRLLLHLRWREGAMYYGLGGVILLIIILIVTGRI